MNSTRKIDLFIVMIVMILSSAFVNARLYEPPTNANLEILAAEVYPLPAKPGEDLFVKINIENYGQSPAEGVVLELEKNYPFNFKYSNKEYGVTTHDANTTIIIPKISAYGSYEAFYYFTIDPMAKSGEHELSFNILRTQEGSLGLTRNIAIKVEGKPELTLLDSSVSPKTITPDDEFEITAKIANIGTGDAQNIRASLILDDETKIAYLDDNTKFIQQLGAGKTETISFNLKISKDAELTSYNIPIKLTATDETGNATESQIESIGFDVKGKAKLNIASIKTNPLIGKSGQKTTLTIRIENIGEGDAESVKASIIDSSFSGVKEAFLGKIEADDDGPAVFTIIPERAGDASYSLRVNYMDDFGIHIINEELTLAVESNGNNGSAAAIIFVLVIVGLGAYYFLRKRKNRRKK